MSNPYLRPLCKKWGIPSGNDEQIPLVISLVFEVYDFFLDVQNLGNNVQVQVYLPIKKAMFRSNLCARYN